jgi:hypothetical protein
MKSKGGQKEVMFWRAMREALYDDMASKPVGKLPLSPRQIEQIKFRYAHGEFQSALALEYRVAQNTISYHVQGVERLCGRGTGIRRIALIEEAA